MKRILSALFLLILTAIAGTTAYFFIGPSGEEKDVLSFIPADFLYAIESDQPIADWQGMSKSSIWKYLKQTEYFKDISESADYLDEMLETNKTLAGLVKLGNLFISAHLISPDKYDYVYLIDMKGRKLGKFWDVIGVVLKSLKYQVSRDKFLGIDIIEMYDPEERVTLYMALYSNILVASYDKGLLKKSLEQSERASIVTNPDYTQVRESTGTGGLYSIYINYANLNRLLGVYTTQVPEMLQGINRLLTFSSMDLRLDDDKVTLKGYLKQVDTVASFLSIFKDAPRGRIQAHEILPANTAMYTSIGFGEFIDFYDRFTNLYRQENPKDYEDFQKRREQLEKFLKIDFQDVFFSWMTDEVATAIVPTDSLQKNYAYYALLHFDSYDKALDRLNFLEEQIRKRTPAKFEVVEYQGFPIHYLEIKGFFKLFFKRMFSKIERPHYTYIGDYVVFSNNTEDLKFIIDQYLAQQSLRKDEKFRRFFSSFNSQSNVFTYINNDSFFNYFLSTLDFESRQGIKQYESYLKSFPRIGFQLSPSSGMYESLILSDFVPLMPETSVQ